MKFSSLVVSFLFLVGHANASDTQIEDYKNKFGPDHVMGAPHRSLRKDLSRWKENAADSQQDDRKLSDASATFYDDYDAFIAAGMGQLAFVCENFETSWLGSALPPFNVLVALTCFSALSSDNLNNGCLFTGLIPGFALMTKDPHFTQTGDLIHLLPGIDPTLPTKSVGINAYSEAAIILFDDPTDSVYLTVSSNDVMTNPPHSSVAVEAFDQYGNSLYQGSVVDGSFVGFIADDNVNHPIKKITLQPVTGEAVNFDDLCFVPNSGGALKDPHFKAFSGKWYDYMGECDLHLLQAPFFAGDTGLYIDIRTRIRYDYSYIESAAIKIGEDVLEVASFGEYFVNGVEGAVIPHTLGGFPLTFSRQNENSVKFDIQLAKGENIAVSTYKDMVSVMLNNADKTRFHGAKGMMGDFDSKTNMARNGTVVIEDPNELASSWQVRHDDPMLFQTRRAPQHPQACNLPSEQVEEMRRLLVEHSISQEAAEVACSKWPKDMQEGCIHDVIATGDLDLAAAGAF